MSEPLDHAEPDVDTGPADETGWAPEPEHHGSLHEALGTPPGIPVLEAIEPPTHEVSGGLRAEPDDAPSRSAQAAARRRRGLDRTTSRLVLVTLLFGGLYAGIAGRLAWLGIDPVTGNGRHAAEGQVAAARPDIVDRDGRMLATDVQIPSVYAEPNKLIDVDEATEALAGALPGLDAHELREKLASRKGFVWVKRQITPDQQAAIFRLGIPGIGFVTENKRLYPNGSTLSHVIGAVNTDNEGIAGIEKYIDNSRGLAELHAMGYAADPADLQPLQLSIDLRAQAVVHEELAAGMARFRAKAGAAAIMDVNTGEMVSLVSMPDFDPNVPADALLKDNINRVNVGVFEMGSTFKALDLAMGIESGRFTTASMLDAIHPLYYGRFAITDYHAQHRMLSLPEVFTYSSNLGAARIALAMGTEAQKAFLKMMGQLDRLKTELPENAMPLFPAKWAEVNTVTISYGHGIAVAPLQALMAVGALMNGGHLIKPTFLKRSEADAMATAQDVIKPHTSDVMRYLLRLNATQGSAKKADIPGYDVGGKTGTAEKIVNGHYDHHLNFTTFMAVFPFDKPKYLVLCLYDEPKPTPDSYGYTTAAWNSGVTTGRIVERVAPLLGVEKRFVPVPNDPPPLYAPGDGVARANAVRPVAVRTVPVKPVRVRPAVKPVADNPTTASLPAAR